MRITHLTLKNWRNFKTVDADLYDRLFIVGPNASGKSNVLDSLRFLRDIVSIGGGFQHAVESRGGIPRIRCLAARSFNGGHVGIEITLGTDDELEMWRYALHFTAESRGKHRPRIASEEIWRGGELLLARPQHEDEDDPDRLTQTVLEQVNANRDFRPISEFLNSIRYMHLVPQVLREPKRGGDHTDDPFGGDFLPRLAKTLDATRKRRLKTIGEALRIAVPQLKELELIKDDDGTPHLQVRHEHWRIIGAKQDERDLSDGTIRLIGLLWALLDHGRAGTTLLLEEPELSLHSSVVRQLPSIFSRVRRSGGSQVILTTHAQEILVDEGIDPREVLVLTPGSEGTEASLASENPQITSLLSPEINLEDILRPITEPQGIAQLSFSLK